MRSYRCDRLTFTVDPRPADRQSEKVANRMRKRRLPAETCIGLLAPRSCQSVTAFIGILKANLAYPPLDVNMPTARIKAILSAFRDKKLVLLGSGVAEPDVRLPDLEMVPVDELLAHDNELELNLANHLLRGRSCTLSSRVVRLASQKV